MKIIFSKKGLDSGMGNGGWASPIFPSGEFYSMPIRESTGHAGIRYADMEHSIGAIVYDLTGGQITCADIAHLDPDLDRDAVRRRPQGWRPVFGQAMGAEGVLANQGVDVGDIFLFYGPFRRVEQVAIDGAYQYAHHDLNRGRYRFVNGQHVLHVMFGWLQIEQRISVVNQWQEIPQYAQAHVHVQGPPYGHVDCIYTSSEWLQLPGYPGNRSGAGLFRNYDENFCLTALGPQNPHVNMTWWRLPHWFMPQNGVPGLGYIPQGNPWEEVDDGNYVLFHAPAHLQELVFDFPENHEVTTNALNWLNGLIPLPAGP